MTRRDDALFLQVALCGGAYWLGGLPLLLAWMIGCVVWRALAKRRRDSRMTREHFERMELASLRAEAEGRDRPTPPPGAMVFPSGAYVPPPDPNDLTYLSAVALLRGDTGAARRVYEATQDPASKHIPNVYRHALGACEKSEPIADRWASDQRRFWAVD